jgi:predicted SAM-dependent methyltransferase
LKGVASDSLDFVASSHCLEHMVNPVYALARWFDVLKPGGHLAVTVPDFDLYEGGSWPSKYNADHKWKFTLSRPHSERDKLLNVLNLIGDMDVGFSVERVQLVRDFYSPALAHTDQTLLPNVESCIEFVLRKHG